MNADVKIVCVSCHARFLWTAGEQRYFEHHGLTTPKHCLDCRSARKTTGCAIVRFRADQRSADRAPWSQQQPVDAIAGAAVAPSEGKKGGIGWLLILGLLAALLCGALLLRDDSTAARGRGVTTTRVRLRAGPDTTQPILGVLDRDAQVTILDRVGDWLQVDHQGRLGFVHGKYVSIVSTEPPPGEPARQAYGLLPAHHRLLEQTGWLAYVQGNIDLVEYYPWPGFQTAEGSVTGVAVYENGQRIARIATEDRDDVSVVGTVVELAAYLAGIPETGTFFGRDVGEELKERFLGHVCALREQEMNGVRDAH